MVTTFLHSNLHAPCDHGHATMLSKPEDNTWFHVAKNVDDTIIAAGGADDGNNQGTESAGHNSQASSLGITYCVAGDIVLMLCWWMVSV